MAFLEGAQRKLTMEAQSWCRPIRFVLLGNLLCVAQRRPFCAAVHAQPAEISGSEADKVI